jgi:rRNA maturation endonuclease Nob1
MDTSRMTGGEIVYGEQEEKTMTIPYKSFYTRMKYLTSMFENKPSDSEREGLFMRTFKEIPVIVKDAYNKIKRSLDELDTPTLPNENATFRPTEVRKEYNEKDDKHIEEDLLKTHPVEVVDPDSVNLKEDTMDEDEDKNNDLTDLKGTIIKVEMELCVWCVVLGEGEGVSEDMKWLSVCEWGVEGVEGGVLECGEGVGVYNVIKGCEGGEMLLLYCGDKKRGVLELEKSVYKESEIYKKMERERRVVV